MWAIKSSGSSSEDSSFPSTYEMAKRSFPKYFAEGDAVPTSSGAPQPEACATESEVDSVKNLFDQMTIDKGESKEEVISDPGTKQENVNAREEVAEQPPTKLLRREYEQELSSADLQQELDKAKLALEKARLNLKAQLDTQQAILETLSKIHRDLQTAQDNYLVAQNEVNLAFSRLMQQTNKVAAAKGLF